MLIFFMIAASWADDYDRDAMAKLTAGSQTVARTVATSGKQPSCPPQNPPSPPLPSLVKENCPGFVGQAVGKFPVTEVPTLRLGVTTPVSVVEKKDLDKLYHTVMKLNLPWGNRTMCVQRALILSYCLKNVLGVEVAKLFVDNNGGVIIPQYPEDKIKGKTDRKVEPWITHQAVQIMVRDAKGNISPFVIDPATRDHIAPIEEWKNVLQGHGAISVGPPSAMSVEEAERASPPQYNSDAGHQVDRLWKMF